jgi:hypothetical protein
LKTTEVPLIAHNALFPTSQKTQPVPMLKTSRLILVTINLLFIYLFIYPLNSQHAPLHLVILHAIVDWLRAGRSGDRIPVWGEIFRTRPDWTRGPPSLLHNGYRHSRRLRVASGATAPGPALEGAPRFRPMVVLISLSSYILR